MRIALLTYSTRPRGGVVHTLALAEALAARGATVTVYAVGRDGDRGFFRPVAPGVAVRLAPLADVPGETVGARVLRSIDALAAVVDLGEHDVVHAQDCISANAVPTAVRTVHHIDHFTTPELAECHERAIVGPPAHVCVSAAVAAELRAGWGIMATVIPNGVDAVRFAHAASSDPPAVAARRRWRELLGPGLLVVTVGGIEPRKGSIDLVEALGLLRDRGRALTLAVAGGETLFDYRDYRAAFDDACARRGVVPEVLGPVDHDRLPALVATADAFAFPSAREGFGLAAMEALAAGVPVVARDLPVLREVFGGTVRYGADPPGLAAALAAAVDRPDPSRQASGR
ncbi:MAG TPA: MSMEG_0565 family glycosyltransferase, partial [Acidimicrobiales bacterium]|nr:MSMEG_0565 family glycosyltransferase [Acidimicrobiales bacterium]